MHDKQFVKKNLYYSNSIVPKHGRPVFLNTGYMITSIFVFLIRALTDLLNMMT